MTILAKPGLVSLAMKKMASNGRRNAMASYYLYRLVMSASMASAAGGYVNVAVTM
jgi:hypothetical protein